jgi:hypothetical protein
MKGEYRRMKAYHPRKRRTKLEMQSAKAQKQQLGDLEHQLSVDVGSYLVLNEEGNKEQAEQALHKTRNDLLKFGPEMKKISNDIGGKFPEIVDEFLTTIDTLVHSPIQDEAKVAACYRAAEDLEKLLYAA